MSTVETEDKLANAKQQGQAQFDSIKEMVLDLERADEGDKVGFAAVEEVRERIYEDALSVEVRSDWYVPGDRSRHDVAEYRILLCTGGPAVQIIGELNEHGEPETARLQVRDWFQPWTDMRPLVDTSKSPKGREIENYDSEPILLAYARCFYFGE
jgi:hypothetical protein